MERNEQKFHGVYQTRATYPFSAAPRLYAPLRNSSRRFSGSSPILYPPTNFKTSIARRARLEQRQRYESGPHVAEEAGSACSLCMSQSCTSNWLSALGEVVCCQCTGTELAEQQYADLCEGIRNRLPSTWECRFVPIILGTMAIQEQAFGEAMQ